MPLQDRTNEFLSCVESIRSRSSLPAKGPSKQRRLDDKARADSKSEFTRMASVIGKDISATTVKLGKLAQCGHVSSFLLLAALKHPWLIVARRKTLFDDRPVEISELTFVIKQDIASINKQIATLQVDVKQRKAQSGVKSAEEKQVEEHNHNVVMLLQNKLADTSMAFKDVLEVRTQNMKESRDRTEQFMSSAAAAAANQAPSSQSDSPCGPFSELKLAHLGSFLFSSTQRQDPMGDGSSGRTDTKGKGRATPNDGVLALDLEHAEGGINVPNGGNNAFQQMELVEQQDSYIQSRSTAIESIETTIAELGQIFNQLAHMVAEQRETVQRIDADTLDIASNVGGAQRELLKYYANISSNRWLMLKVFGVLIVFFLIFILVS
ncbi:t-SNARE [Russula ochroleuca]|uniref:t-SNARE n=1 Tax=Russula ochroleuca TaxID=152965 RepID=A0A9P5TAR2_9AGAM|nr:t-SNARE [Russula ochroleuca]